jgi:hypothetical protein
MRESKAEVGSDTRKIFLVEIVQSDTIGFNTKKMFDEAIKTAYKYFFGFKNCIKKR